MSGLVQDPATAGGEASGGLLRPGFAEPALDAQRCFRTLLSAMAHPGRIHALDVAIEPPARLMPGSAALCLTLLDAETPLWLDAACADEEARAYLRFHCGCPLVDDSRAAAFGLVGGALPPLGDFAPGDDLAPEDSATVIWQVEALEDEGPLRLSGPGIDGIRALGLAPLPGHFLEERARGHAAFPAGVDLILVAGSRLVGLPRSTRIETAGEG